MEHHLSFGFRVMDMLVMDGYYEIQKVLWVGDNTITYLAMHKNIDMKVVIKEFFPAQYAVRTENSKVMPREGNEKKFAAGMARFRQEADILNHLGKYGYISQLLELLELNNTYYIVVDYKSGVTLAEYISDHCKPRQDMKKIFHSLFEALMFLHENGVVHLDICPENLIIENQELYLIDFGSAEYISKLSDKVCGEVVSGYEAPELKGTGMPIGTWSDVYELCMVIYCYLEGELPEKWMEISSQKARKHYLVNSLKGYEDSLRKALAGGLLYRPDRRIRTVAELYATLYRPTKFRPSILFFGILVLMGGMTVTAKLAASLPGEILPVWTEESYDRFKKDIVSYTDESLLEYEVKGSGIVIVGCDISLTEVYIPPKIYGLDVIEIVGMGPNVVVVFIPNGVKRIAVGAFRNCVFLERIYIPKSVVKIEADMFANCSMLQELFLEKDQGRYYLKNGVLMDDGGEVAWTDHEK